MSVNSKLYFINRVSPEQLKYAIEKEFGVSPDFKHMKFEKSRFEGDHDKYYGYFYITLKFSTGKSFEYSFYFYQYNYVFGGQFDKTNYDIISGNTDFMSVNILERIVKYFGGWIDKNDCDDIEAVFHERVIHDFELTNEQKLESLIAKSIEIRFIPSILKFLQENKDEILKLNFGIK